MTKRLKTHEELLATGWMFTYGTYYETGNPICPGLTQTMRDSFPEEDEWTWTKGMFITDPTPAISKQTTKAEYLVFLDQTFDGMKKLIQAKQSDYTSNSDDPFANFRSSDEFGVDPLLGVFLRMSDKFQRIKSFSKAGKLEVAGEGVDDAIKDIMGYSLIALALLKEKSDGNKG